MSMTMLIKRYGINDQDIDLMITGILSTKTLDDITTSLSVPLKQEQTYTILRQLSLSQFGESLEYIAPNIVQERDLLSEPKKETWAQDREAFDIKRKEEKREEDRLLAELEKRLED